ncbi:hypothetical protein J6590_082061 [Homalodisca vitripennis]|nr:hypothetical protein J6590_014518 [Homalodisca vitripennis]KAG8295345.1 hypothetical protein J6590_082061 [Homalodisca vitripennis]
MYLKQYKEQKEHTHGEQEMTDNVECESTDTLRSSYSPWDRLLLLRYGDDSTMSLQCTHGEQEMTDNVECASTDTLRSSYSPWDRLLLLRYGDDSTMSLQCTHGEQEMTDNVECASIDTLRSSYSPWDRLLLLRYGDDSTMSLQCTHGEQEMTDNVECASTDTLSTMSVQCTNGEQEMTDNVECASTDTLRSSYSPWDRLLLLPYCDDSTISLTMRDPFFCIITESPSELHFESLKRTTCSLFNEGQLTSCMDVLKYSRSFRNVGRNHPICTLLEPGSED